MAWVSALDLDAVVQATQDLSSKMKVSELLSSLMDLIVTNTGATYVTALPTPFASLLLRVLLYPQDNDCSFAIAHAR
jgi:hypothetical protein